MSQRQQTRIQPFISSHLNKAQSSIQAPLLPPYAGKLPTKSPPIRPPLIGLTPCPLCTRLPNSFLIFPARDTGPLPYGLDIEDGPFGIVPFFDVTAALPIGGRRPAFELLALGPIGIPPGDVNCRCEWACCKCISGRGWKVCCLGVEG